MGNFPLLGSPQSREAWIPANLIGYKCACVRERAGGNSCPPQDVIRLEYAQVPTNLAQISILPSPGVHINANHEP